MLRALDIYCINLPVQNWNCPRSLKGRIWLVAIHSRFSGIKGPLKISAFLQYTYITRTKVGSRLDVILWCIMWYKGPRPWFPFLMNCSKGPFINYDLGGGSANCTRKCDKFFGSPLRESRENYRSPLREDVKNLGSPPTTSDSELAFPNVYTVILKR